MIRLVCLAVFFGLLTILGFASLDIRGPAALYAQVLAGSALLLLVPVAITELRGTERAVDAELRDLVSGSRREMMRLAAIAVLWLLYPVMLTHIGFIAATTILVAASVYILGRHKLLLTGAASLGFAVLFAIALKTVVYVPVPGAWPDRMLEQAIYTLRRN